MTHSIMATEIFDVELTGAWLAGLGAMLAGLGSLLSGLMAWKVGRQKLEMEEAHEQERQARGADR